MLQNIITYLNVKLEETNYFEQLFELCELVKNADGGIVPKQYCEGGEWKEISDFDNYNGMGYWRKNGDTIIREEELQTLSGCEIALSLLYPLKFIACVPKEKLKIDDAYSDERMAIRILQVLTTKSSDLKKEIKAKKISIIPTKYITDNQIVLNIEYSGKNITDIHYKYAYLALDLDVIVIVNKDCLQNECENTYPTY